MIRRGARVARASLALVAMFGYVRVSLSSLCICVSRPHGGERASPTTNLFECLEGLLLQHEFLKVLFVKLISLRGEQQFRLVIARSKNSIQSSQPL